ncbi:protein kinase [Kribbella sp. NPDC051620]|uniref:protein kinase domain-containing protein n=1 Tax=Kribbella sp. NPDC051620 TaxID=3364120 RepID=UPI00379843D7
MTAGHEAGPDRSWQLGQLVADTYEIRAVLGEGGMGIVYQVRHLGWDTDLAVKSPLEAGTPGTTDRDRFIEEAETWVGFGPHPHVCACHYLRVLDGVPRLFIEYVDGGSLAEWIAGGRLYQGTQQEVLTRVLDIAIQAAWGLMYAHGQGVVHQDVKPANILLNTAGTAKITDFGLSRAQSPQAVVESGDAQQSLRVSFGGMTRAYASPEQYSRTAVGRRSDVWSFAVSILEMLVGGITWSAGPAAGAVLAGLRGGGFSAAAIKVPPALDDLLARCLRPDPATRPEMAQVAGELTDLYAEIAHHRYPRSSPRPADLRADELNNRALSLLDLGRPDEALTALDQACSTDPQHPEAAYNRGLLQWRQGDKTDEQLLNELEHIESGGTDPQRIAPLLARINLERGDASTGPIGHLGSKSRVELTADSRHAWSSDENTVTVWDLPSGRKLCTLAGHTGTVYGLAVLPNGRRAVTASGDGTLRVWNTSNGKCVRILSGHTESEVGHVTSVYSVCPVPGRDTVLSAGSDATVREWELSTGRCLRVLRLDWKTAPPLPVDYAPIVQVRASTDEVCVSADRRVILCSSGGRVWVCDYASGDLVHVLTGHTNSVSAVSTTPDSRYALTAGWDATARVWDLATGQLVRTLSTELNSVLSVRSSPDGRHVITRDEHSARVWELATGRCLRTIAPAESAGPIDDETVLVTTPSRDVYAVRSRGGEPAAFQVARPRSTADILAAEGAVGALVEQALAAKASGDIRSALGLLREARQRPGYERAGEIGEAWRGLDGHCEHVTLEDARQAALASGFREAVTAVAVTPDGGYAVTGGFDGKVQVWELANGAATMDLGAEPGVTESVCATSDGAYLAAASTNSVKVWHRYSGELKHALPHPRVVELLHAVPGGRLLSTDLDRDVRVWNLATGKCEATFSIKCDERDFHWARVLCVTPDGRHAVSTHFDGTLRLWDLATGWCVRALSRGTAFTRSGRVTGDGRQLVTAGSDGHVRTWDLITGECLRKLNGHSGDVNSVCLTADDLYAVTAGSDKTVRLWELATGRCLRTLRGHTGPVNSVDVSADGRRIASAGDDSTLRVWELDWDLAVRELTGWQTAIEQYLGVFLAGCAARRPARPRRRLFGQSKSRPLWSDEDFVLLREKLTALGFGGLSSDDVERELHRLVDGAHAVDVQRLESAGIAAYQVVILANHAAERAADGKLPAAIEADGKAVGILRRLVATAPEAYRHDLIARLLTYSVWLSRQGQPEKAVQINEEAIHRCRTARQPGWATPLSVLLHNQAVLFSGMKDRAAVEELWGTINAEFAGSTYTKYLPGVRYPLDPAHASEDLPVVQGLVTQYEQMTPARSALPGLVISLCASARLLMYAGEEAQAKSRLTRLLILWPRWIMQSRNNLCLPVAIGMELIEIADRLGDRTMVNLVRRGMRTRRRV